MEALLERTAISAFIREKKDFYTALFDENGVMAVGSMVPIFGDMTSPVFESFPPETMQPGDLLLVQRLLRLATARSPTPTTRCCWLRSSRTAGAAPS